MNNPLVSIITPCFNSENYISKTINSVIMQSFQQWEMIIVDDFSSDKSVDIIKKLMTNEKRISLIENKENLGSGASRNKAIKIAKSRYIAFLDADDIWHYDKLKIQIKFMIDNKIAFSHTSYGYIDSFDKEIKSPLKVSRHPIDYYFLLKRTEISCLTAVYDSKLIGKYYMPDRKLKQDYALWLSILKNGYKSHPIPHVLAYYRQHANQKTRKKYKLIFSHVIFLKETKNMSILKSIYYTLFWIKNGFFRYIIG